MERPAGTTNCPSVRRYLPISTSPDCAGSRNPIVSFVLHSSYFSYVNILSAGHSQDCAARVSQQQQAEPSLHSGPPHQSRPEDPRVPRERSRHHRQHRAQLIETSASTVNYFPIAFHVMLSYVHQAEATSFYLIIKQKQFFFFNSFYPVYSAYYGEALVLLAS